MKRVRTMAMSAAATLAGSGQALAAAVDTSQTYSSGLLIGLFLAFCVVLVMVQMIPSIMMLIGFIKGLTRRTDVKNEMSASTSKS